MSPVSPGHRAPHRRHHLPADHPPPPASSQACGCPPADGTGAREPRAVRLGLSLGHLLERGMRARIRAGVRLRGPPPVLPSRPERLTTACWGPVGPSSESIRGASRC
jgi:hypothetical protein